MSAQLESGQKGPHSWHILTTATHKAEEDNAENAVFPLQRRWFKCLRLNTLRDFIRLSMFFVAVVPARR